MAPPRIATCLALRDRLAGVDAWLSPPGLRLVLTWELHESGRENCAAKTGSGGYRTSPFPFDRVPADLSWGMAPWFELLGGLALLIGLGAVAASLLVLTVVAIAAVHWRRTGWARLYTADQGAASYKLPQLFLVML